MPPRRGAIVRRASTRAGVAAGLMAAARYGRDAVRHVGPYVRQANRASNAVAATARAVGLKSSFARKALPGGQPPVKRSRPSALPRTAPASQSAGFQQLSSSGTTLGRPASVASLVARMRNMNLGIYKDRFQGVLSMNDTTSKSGGAFYEAGFHTTGGSSPTLYPLYMLQLDCHPGMPLMTSPVAPTGSVFNRLGYNGGTTSLCWYTQAGVAAMTNSGAPVTGTNNYPVSLSLKGDSALNLLVSPYFMTTPNVVTLKDLTLTILVRCPTSRPLFAKFTLCQVHEDYQVALAGAVVTTPGTGGSPITGDEKSFYERLVKPYLYNPLVKDAPTVGPKKTFKAIKSWTVKAQPDASTNKDAIGLQKKLQLKLNLNRVRNYLTAQPTTSIADLDTAQANFQGKGNSYIVPNNPIPASRLYLMMRFSSYDEGATAFDPTLHASFDMVMDRTWVIDPSS